MTTPTPTLEERLERYTRELDEAATAFDAREGTSEPDPSSRRPALLAVAAAILLIAGVAAIAIERSRPASPVADDAPLPRTPAPPVPQPTTTDVTGVPDPASTVPGTNGAGVEIAVPELVGDVYRPPWDPIAVAPGTIGWFDFGDGVPDRVRELPLAPIGDAAQTAGFFRCGTWTVVNGAPQCTELLGGNGVEHVSYGDLLGVGVELGGTTTVEEQLWEQARGSLWGYEEVTTPPEPTIVSVGSIDGVSYRNGDHAYLAWQHESGALLWLESRGLSDEELAAAAVGVRPADLPDELPLLLVLHPGGPSTVGPGNNSDDRSVKLGYLDGSPCLGTQMWTSCWSTVEPSVFHDGQTVVAAAPSPSGLSLKVGTPTGSAADLLELTPVGVAGIDLAVINTNLDSFRAELLDAASDTLFGLDSDRGDDVATTPVDGVPTPPSTTIADSDGTLVGDTLVPAVDGTVLVANANTVGGSAGALTARLELLRFDTAEPANSTLGSGTSSTSTVYIRPGSECLGLQVASAVGIDRIESFPDPLPIESTDTADDVEVVVLLADDLAARLGDPTYRPTLGPAGQLLVVVNEGVDVEPIVADLRNSGIERIRTTTSAQRIPESMLFPIGESTPWTCAVADAAGIGGFDTLTPTLLDEPLPEDVDAVLAVAR